MHTHTHTHTHTHRAGVPGTLQVLRQFRNPVAALTSQHAGAKVKNASKVGPQALETHMKHVEVDMAVEVDQGAKNLRSTVPPATGDAHSCK